MSVTSRLQDNGSAQVVGTIYKTFEEAASREPDKPALIDHICRRTYAQLIAECRSVAGMLRQVDESEPAIGLLLPHSGAFWVAILGCLAVGRAYLALDADHPVGRNTGIITASGIRTVITSRQHATSGWIPKGIRCLQLDELVCAPEPANLPVPVSDPARPACVLYTSGSTGQPKGVVNSEYALSARVRSYSALGGFSPDDRFLTLSSPCTIAGTREGLTALTLGGTLLVRDLRRSGLGAVREIISAEGVTVLNAVPSALRPLMPGAGGPDLTLASLRVVRVGGETLFWSDVRQFRAALPRECTIIAGYSATEQTGTQWVIPHIFPTEGPFVPVGSPLPENRFNVVNEQGDEVEEGEVGELVVRSPSVALGYLRAGKVVPGDITTDPKHLDVRVFRTGDLLRKDAGELFTFIGRKDRQVKINGQRVEPAEVEARLRACPEVADAAVITRREDHTAWLEAFVVLAPAVPNTALMLVQERIERELTTAMRPRRTHVLEAIPRLVSLKTDVAALEAFAEAAGYLGAAKLGDPASEPLARANDALSDTVQRAWREVLGSGAQTGESFGAAGGDSLRLLELALLIEQRLGRRLPFEAFTLEMGAGELISSLERSESDTNAAGRPRVFVCPGYHGDDLRFMSLRMELKDAIAFTPLRYPDWSEMAAGDPCEVLLNSVVTQITDAAPEGTLMLLGYSFGGGAALMAAHRLRAQGRTLRWLGIIDSSLVPPITTRAPVIGARLRDLREEIARVRGFAGLGGVVGFLVLGHCLRDLIGLSAAGELAHLRYLLPRRTRIVLDRWLGMTMRGQIIPSWESTLPPPLADVPTVLFRSQAHALEEPEDLGWRARCPDLSIIPVTGDHGTMLDPPNRWPILEGLRNALCAPASHMTN